MVEMDMPEPGPTVTVEGVEVPPLHLHWLVVATVPGSGVSERVTVVKTLITEKGEFVLVTAPYAPLAKRQQEG